jgi:hypothetical protein
MGNLNINNPNIIRDRPFSSQHYTESVKQLDFKPDRNHDQVDSDLTRGSLQKDLLIFHQNIRGLNGKNEEIMINIASNPPHVLCFTEHYLELHQLECVPFRNYRLVAYFCRTTYRYGGVCIYVHESLQASNMEVLKYCKEKDLEVSLFFHCACCYHTLFKTQLMNCV